MSNYVKMGLFFVGVGILFFIYAYRLQRELDRIEQFYDNAQETREPVESLSKEGGLEAGN